MPVHGRAGLPRMTSRGTSKPSPSDRRSPKIFSATSETFAPSALTRFRGFAPEKSIFARMAPGKPLIIRGYMERMRAKTAVVKTYPVPAGSFRSLDSPRHVFTADPANEGRQDAQLLERRREPAS